MGEPLKWKSPRRIFVNSMSDLFHKEVPKEFVDDVFATMERAHWHTFQLLTKRSSSMRRYVNERYAGSMALTAYLDRRVRRRSEGAGPTHAFEADKSKRPVHLV